MLWIHDHCRWTLPLAILILGGCTDTKEVPEGDQQSDQSPNFSKFVEPDDAGGFGNPEAIRFRSCSDDCGLRFQYENGQAAGHFSILESLGGGVAAIDIDRDGFDDICLAGGGEFGRDRSILPKPTGMFRNKRGLSWSDVSDVAGVKSNRYYSHGTIRADFDADGLPDFLVTGYGGLELFHNMGDGTFHLATDESGLSDRAWSSSAAWGDLNADGWLDLYVAHYVDWSWSNDPVCVGPNGHPREICPPRSYSGLKDIVYVNSGDGTFVDATEQLKLNEAGKGLGVVMGDFDVDGDCDVYVTNDTVPNFLYQNPGDGTLLDVSLQSGASLNDRGSPDGSMGVDVLDYNTDGLPDLWVANYERETNALYQNVGSMGFRHVSQKTGVSVAAGMFVGWGTACQDFDNDGDEDIVVANGHVVRFPTNSALMQLPVLLENQAGTRFRNVAMHAGNFFLEEHMGRGLSASDFDLSGDVDFVVSRTNQQAILLWNETKNGNDWCSVILVGRKSPREPVGAVIRLRSPHGNQTRFVKSGGSYASSSSERILFGLGAESGPVVIEVTWPSGRTQTLENVVPGRHLTIVESGSDDQGSGQIVEFVF